MSHSPNLERIHALRQLREGMTLDREILIDIIRARPDMTLSQLAELGPKLLGRVRVGDLIDVLHTRRRAAEQARGADFDRLVLAAVGEAEGPIGASFVRARVGGPRWKLQQSFGRLVQAGMLRRTGTTGMTRYCVSGRD